MINWQGQYIAVITVFCIFLVGFIVVQGVVYNKSVVGLSRDYVENCEKPKEILVPVNTTNIQVKTEVINNNNNTATIK